MFLRARFVTRVSLPLFSLVIGAFLGSHFNFERTYSRQEALTTTIPGHAYHTLSKEDEGRTLHADLPIIFAITPTYTRHVQKAELTRICHTFMHVPRLHWIVVEDAKNKTQLVAKHLSRCGVPYTHLNAFTIKPKPRKDSKNRTIILWGKGVLQRNTGLKWLRDQADGANGTRRGVVYFADDDNVYDLELFERMRHVKKASAWAVAFVGGLLVERPIFDEETKLVVGWNSLYQRWRRYPVG
ncbi:unnamed protein product, partial [Notodromas monacha]